MAVTAVWPDVEIKSRPIFLQKLPKKKPELFFKIAQKVTK